jgi:hypothetical protein
VERYYGLIRRAYDIIITEISGISKEIGLQIAFKAINDSVGPNGIVPTLLVYGAKYNPLSPSVVQCSAALKKAIMEI